MRDGGFPAPDEPIDDGGTRKAGALSPATADLVLVSPALAARQTAEALGLSATIEPGLRDVDHGGWAGKSFEAVHATEPSGFATWMGDPSAGTPGGESLSDVSARLLPWFQPLAGRGGTIIAITHPMIVRSLLALALDMPVAATMRIDVAPLSTAILSFNGHWRLQSLARD